MKLHILYYTPHVFRTPNMIIILIFFHVITFVTCTYTSSYDYPAKRIVLYTVWIKFFRHNGFSYRTLSPPLFSVEFFVFFFFHDDTTQRKSMTNHLGLLKYVHCFRCCWCCVFFELFRDPTVYKNNHCTTRCTQCGVWRCRRQGLTEGGVPSTNHTPTFH